MKPTFTKILETGEIQTFFTKCIIRQEFSTEFHFHTACQLTYISHSQGKRIIGDNVDRYEPDELTFIGADVPHVWHNDLNSFPLNNTFAQSLALFIDPISILDLFKNFFNTQKLESFFKNSKRGLIFYGDTKEILKNKLADIITYENSPKKTILLIEILDILSTSKEYEYLTSVGYKHNFEINDNDKIEKIFKFVFDNFSKEICLDDISNRSNMSKHAFCRYFKSKTQKTFMQFVNEVRISEACKLITANDMQIMNIAFECGFNSISNFNKIFKQIKGLTPTEFKIQFFE